MIKTQLVQAPIHKLVRQANTVQKPPRLIDISLSESKQTEPQLVPFSNFQVNESGHYNISMQIVFQASEDSNVDMIQYGLCQESQDDFADVFSSVGSQGLVNECYLSFNLSTVKYMEKDTDYISWYNVLLNSGKLNYLCEHSKLKLIKL